MSGSIGGQSDAHSNVHFSTAKQVAGAAVALGGVALLVASIALPIFRHSTISLALAGKILGGMAVGGMAMGVGLHMGLQARVNKTAQQHLAPQAQSGPKTQEQLAQAALDQVHQPKAKKEHDERKACLEGRFTESSFNDEITAWNSHIQRQDTSPTLSEKRYPVESVISNEGTTNGHLHTHEVVHRDREHQVTNLLNVSSQSRDYTLNNKTISTSSSDTIGIEKNGKRTAAGWEHTAMEDAHSTRQVQLGPQQGLLSLVCDGHGDYGTIARYANENFSKALDDAYEYFKQKNKWNDDYTPQPHEMANILSRACVMLHATICDEQSGPTMTEMGREHEGPKNSAGIGGACFVGSLILGNNLYTFNLGDSRVVLAYKTDDKTSIQSLTYDAKANDPQLKDDIEQRGGTVSEKGRLSKHLASCRSLGDADPEVPGSSCIPIINYVHLDSIKQQGVQEAHIVVGCDGVFDRLTSQDVGNIALETEGDPSLKIIEESLKGGSGDNISVIHMKIPL